MKKIVSFLGAAALLVGMASNASANNVTLTAAQIQAFTYTSGTSTNTFTGFDLPLTAGAQFTAINGDPTVTMTTNFDSLTGLGVGAAGDTFRLAYFNSNSSPWTWTVTLFNAASVSLGSASTSVPSGAHDTFIIPISGTIDHVRLTATGCCFSDGQGGFDRTANSDITSSVVPEPASLALLGTGLAGLAAGLRRRKKA